jgi:hypothetical protein
MGYADILKNSYFKIALYISVRNDILLRVIISVNVTIICTLLIITIVITDHFSLFLINVSLQFFIVFCSEQLTCFIEVPSFVFCNCGVMHPKNNTILNTVPTTHKYRLTCDTCKHNFHSLH